MKHSQIVLVLLIAVVGFIVYANSLDGSFIWDDNHLVRNNVHIRSFSNIPKAFSQDIRVSNGRESKFYRPLQLISYMGDYSLWGLGVEGYHLTNTILHILVALCLFWMSYILFGNKLLSFFAGILFVVHPVHTEAVSYISGRADLLGALFIMLSFIFYVKANEKKKHGPLIIAILMFISALFSKESALVFPVLLLVYHYSFKIRIKPARYIPFILTALFYAILRLTILRALLPAASDGPAFLDRIPGFFVAITNYSRILFFPFDLHMEYGKKLFVFMDPKAISGLAIFASLFFFALRKKSRLLLFSIGWFFAALLPHSNLYLVNAYMAEHWLYLPSVGFFLIAGKALSKFWIVKPVRGIVIIVIILLVSYFAILTVNQNNYWKDPVAFCEHTLAFAPRSAKAYNYYGNVLDKLGRKEEAHVAYRKVIELDPLYKEAYNNLGVLYKEFGKPERAMALHERAIEIDPNFTGSYNNIGVLHYNEGNFDKAIGSYKKAVEIDPYFAIAYNNMGAAFKKLGEIDKATSLYRKAIEIDSACIEAYVNLGSYYGTGGNHKEAIKYFKQAVVINPELGAGYNNLAIAYYHDGQYDLAVESGKRAMLLGYPVNEKTLTLLNLKRK